MRFENSHQSPWWMFVLGVFFCLRSGLLWDGPIEEDPGFVFPGHGEVGLWFLAASVVAWWSGWDDVLRGLISWLFFVGAILSWVVPTEIDTTVKVVGLATVAVATLRWFLGGTLLPVRWHGHKAHHPAHHR